MVNINISGDSSGSISSSGSVPLNEHEEYELETAMKEYGSRVLFRKLQS
jgi:hypothetical protein